MTCAISITHICVGTPFGQMPLLEFEGQVYAQSLAIARFLAKKYDLYGDTPEAQLKADMVVDYVAEFFQSKT